MPAAVANERRLEHIDLVRGYALLGVLLMNIQYWLRNPPMRYWSSPDGHPWPGRLNFATDLVLSTWFDGKSVTIFAMLFAIGLCMQRDSIVAKGLRWGPYSFRRLGAMAGFGALHILLFWNGDVLHQYAICGLLILPFLKRQPRTLSWWTGIILGLAALAILIMGEVQAFRPPPPIDGTRAKEQAAWAQALIQGYSQHSWSGVMRTRLWDWAKMLRMMLPGVPIFMFVTFLTGLWIWSRGILQDPGPQRAKLGRVAAWCLSVGFATNLLNAFGATIFHILRGHWKWAKLAFPVLGFSQAFGTLILATGIGAGLVWLWQDPAWRDRLRPLTFVGRMGFTNYIMQSVVCTFIFYGWGLGLYNRVGPAIGTLIGLAIFAAQIPFSRWWLLRFHFGPMEWAWRSVTYGAAAPFRRQPPALLPEPAEA